MRTSKAFSTISYNSDKFLIFTLNNLVQTRVIDFWLFINHFPESDESKKHKHLFIIPNGTFDTDGLKDYLTELVPGCDKPLCCIFCKSSKFIDFFLYSIHDEVYLASKGQSRVYHYSLDDFFTSDIDYFCELRHQMDLSKLNRLQFLKESAQNGETFSSLVTRGMIPVQLINQYHVVYDLLVSETYRNGRSTHTSELKDITDSLPEQLNF